MKNNQGDSCRPILPYEITARSTEQWDRELEVICQVHLASARILTHPEQTASSPWKSLDFWELQSRAELYPKLVPSSHKEVRAL